MFAVLQLLKHVKGLQEIGKSQYLNSKYYKINNTIS